MVEPKLQHYADELRGIAKILDLLNDPVEGDSNMGILGCIELWNVDMLLGTLKPDECGHWVYYPTADDQGDGKKESHD